MEDQMDANEVLVILNHVRDEFTRMVSNVVVEKALLQNQVEKLQAQLSKVNDALTTANTELASANAQLTQATQPQGDDAGVEE